jgi:hypothetical protein
VRTHQAADTGTVPQQDENTASVPNRGPASPQPPYGDLKMPHERDETPPSPSDTSRGRIRQGEADVANGLENTERYGSAGVNYDRRNGDAEGGG